MFTIYHLVCKTFVILVNKEYQLENKSLRMNAILLISLLLGLSRIISAASEAEVKKVSDIKNAILTAQTEAYHAKVEFEKILREVEEKQRIARNAEKDKRDKIDYLKERMVANWEMYKQGNKENVVHTKLYGELVQKYVEQAQRNAVTVNTDSSDEMRQQETIAAEIEEIKAIAEHLEVEATVTQQQEQILEDESLKDADQKVKEAEIVADNANAQLRILQQQLENARKEMNDKAAIVEGWRSKINHAVKIAQFLEHLKFLEQRDG